MKIKLISIYILSLICAQSFASPQQDSIVKPDLDPVVMALDTLSYNLFTREKLFANSAELQRAIAMTPDQLPHYTDLEMKVRMKEIPSIIQLDYNADVKSFIDLFVYRRRDLMSKLQASSQIYFPYFEEILARKKLPDELKYLPLIESALNPTAVSSAGATGLWQLMLGTGKMMGCDANSCVDERRDPIKSTEAATNYLKQLYDMYGDWQLALAAYNSGPGWVNKAIARAGTKNFWAIKYYLPSETRSYVPTYIAMVYAMKYAKDYQLLSAEPKRELYAVDTVVVGGKVTLKHISNVLGISEAELQFINPSLKIGIVPLVKGGFPLNLPINYFVQFENKKDQILNDPAITSQEAIADGFANPEFIRVPKYVWYKVRRNDNLAGIAARYGVSSSDIKQWNHLRSSTVQRGQNLKIMTYVQVPNYKKEAQPATGDSSAHSSDPEIGSTAELDTSENILYYIEKDANGNIIKRIMKPENQVIKPVTQNRTAQPKPAAPAPPKSRVHLYKVQSGDTLSSIARRNGVTVAKLCSTNGLSTKSILHKGQVIKIVQ